MMKKLSLLSLLLLCTHAFASGPADAIREVFSVCSEKGFSSESCQGRLYGPNRGITAVLIANEVRNRAESEYQKFLAQYPSFMGLDITVTNFRFSLETNLNFNPNFDDVTDDFFTKSGRFWILQEETPIMAMTLDNGTWKLAFSDAAEQQFRTSEMYNIYVVSMIRANILRYHIAKAAKESTSKGALMDEVAYASIPLLLALQPEKRDELGKFVKYTVDEVISTYGPLDSEEAINKRLGSPKKLNKG